MIRKFRGRTTRFELKIGKFLNLLGLSESAAYVVTSSESDGKKDENDKCDKKFHRHWSHGGATRVVSDDEFGDDGHC